MTDFSNDLEQCLRVLAEGGVILYPTDTVWGLGCDATNKMAVEKLVQLKGKAGKNGLIVLLAAERDVLHYVTEPDLAVFDYLKNIQKPTTVIYKSGTGVADGVLAFDGSIAIRLVRDMFCRHLVKRFRKPLVSTSANFHTEATPVNFSAISATLKQQVDYIVDYRRSEPEMVAPSSIIRWHSNGLSGYPEMIRP